MACRQHESRKRESAKTVSVKLETRRVHANSKPPDPYRGRTMRRHQGWCKGCMISITSRTLSPSIQTSMLPKYLILNAPVQLEPKPSPSLSQLALFRPPSTPLPKVSGSARPFGGPVHWLVCFTPLLQQPCPIAQVARLDQPLRV